MRGALSLVLAGVVAVTLGVLGSVALVTSLTGSSAEAVKTVGHTDTKPSVYGTR